ASGSSSESNTFTSFSLGSGRGCGSPVGLTGSAMASPLESDRGGDRILLTGIDSTILPTSATAGRPSSRVLGEKACPERNRRAAGLSVTSASPDYHEELPRF